MSHVVNACSFYFVLLLVSCLEIACEMVLIFFFSFFSIIFLLFFLFRPFLFTFTPFVLCVDC